MLTINPLAGFPLDPFLVTAQGGGPVAANTLSKNCTGYIPAKPTVTVDYKGKADVLKAFFYSDGDTTLVVQTPDGKYVCGDDTNRLVLDPTVEIKQAGPGTLQRLGWQRCGQGPGAGLPGVHRPCRHGREQARAGQPGETTGRA